MQGPTAWDEFRHMRDVAFYASGTAALAAALQHCLPPASEKPPEVIVPAYSSFDILNALEYLRIKPVFVDFEADRPWIDTAALANRLTERTIAVIAVRLFGLRERLGAIREALADTSVRIVSDCCHSWPGAAAGDDPAADYAVFSFGRGKQLNLLGGGALVRNEDRDLPPLDPPPPAPRRRFAAAAFRLKATAYNTFTHPRLFGVLDSAELPGVRDSGRARRVLGSIDAMPTHVRSRVGPLQAGEPRYGAAQARIASVVGSLPASVLCDLPVVCGHKGARGLLRYPVLLRDREVRDACLTALSDRGLGASRMYSCLLSDRGSAGSVNPDPEPFQHARSFCDRLLTLPVHAFVRDRDVDRIQATLLEVLGPR